MFHFRNGKPSTPEGSSLSRGISVCIEGCGQGARRRAGWEMGYVGSHWLLLGDELNDPFYLWSMMISLWR